jgi:hypothetical protein
MSLRIKITIETQRMLMTKGRGQLLIWCPECNAETYFVAYQDLQNLFQKLNKTIKTANLHQLQTSQGTQLICLESVLKDQYKKQL